MNLDLQYQTQLYIGLFEREIERYVRSYSRTARTAIDIGAAYGEYTLYFLRQRQLESILAFEPNQESRDQVMTNARLNGMEADKRLSLIPKMVTSENTKNSCTLDSLASSVAFPCIVKMDVDGGEVDILNGAREFMKNEGTRWVIETHSPELEAECIQILKASRFKTRIVENAWWRAIVPEQRPILQNRWLVATRNEEF